MGVEGVPGCAGNHDAEDRGIGRKPFSAMGEKSGRDVESAGFADGAHQPHLRLVELEPGLLAPDDPFNWLFANHNKPGAHPPDEDIWQ